MSNQGGSLLDFEVPVFKPSQETRDRIWKTLAEMGITEVVISNETREKPVDNDTPEVSLEGLLNFEVPVFKPSQETRNRILEALAGMGITEVVNPLDPFEV